MPSLIGIDFDHTANAAGQRYQTFLVALNGLYMENLSGAGTARTRNNVLRGGVQLGLTHVETERGVLADAIDRAAMKGWQDVQDTLGADLPTEHTPDVVERLIDDQTDAVEHALRLQIERDLQAVINALRMVGLKTEITARAGGLTRNQARSQVIDRVQGIDFSFMDRGGRRWASRTYVRTIARHGLVHAYNHAAMLAIGDAGLAHATIHHPDANYEHQGTVIALAGDPRFQSWEDVQDQFHPNSNAWLEPYRVGE